MEGQPPLRVCAGSSASSSATEVRLGWLIHALFGEYIPDS